MAESLRGSRSDLAVRKLQCQGYAREPTPAAIFVIGSRGMSDPLLARIPQRAPYLLLDEILSASDGACRAAARAPANPILLVERCAQAAAAFQSPAPSAEPAAGVLAAVLRFRIHRMPTPGEPLVIEVHQRAVVQEQTLVRARVTSGPAPEEE